MSIYFGYVEASFSAEVQDDHADQQTDIAHAIGEERFERGVGVWFLFPPMPDQAKRADADEFPTHDELQGRRRQHHKEHRCGKERKKSEVVSVPTITLDVVGRVKVDKPRDDRNDKKHHDRLTIDQGSYRDTRSSRGASTCGKPTGVGDDGRPALGPMTVVRCEVT